MSSTSIGDVSLKSYHQLNQNVYDESLSVSNDSSEEIFVTTTGFHHRSVSPSSKLSLLAIDDEHMDEFDAACTILNELQMTGVISCDEKQRRKNLVMQYLEFAANGCYADDNDANRNSSHSWGPMLELVQGVVGCWRYICCLKST